MRGVSAFTGIGGFDVGLADAGIETVCQIEWDPHCSTILARQFPDTMRYGDISDVRGTDIGGIDLAHGGFPCQGTSTAAPHRGGLHDERSHHFYEFTRLVGEYARLVDDTNPRWVVIENPPGLLRSNDGRDMAAVAGHLEDLGYGWAYRVVDGRFFGSPQRRQRVIVVGHRGGDPRPAWAVLGDAGGGVEADRPGQVGGRTLGPRPVGGVGDGFQVWRKSARARAALSKGGYETWVADGFGNTLTGFDGGGPARQTHLIAQGGGVRTLTLTEWERLQMFPDGWTEGVPDSARFTMLGNAMHVGMAQWLGHRLVSVDQALPSLV
jgi:DNA (cytosine-5)-methyltransferase 1